MYYYYYYSDREVQVVSWDELNHRLVLPCENWLLVLILRCSNCLEVHCQMQTKTFLFHKIACLFVKVTFTGKGSC